MKNYFILKRKNPDTPEEQMGVAGFSDNPNQANHTISKIIAHDGLQEVGRTLEGNGGITRKACAEGDYLIKDNQVLGENIVEYSVIPTSFMDDIFKSSI